jgi:xanthine dehydrogenase accessory factor
MKTIFHELVDLLNQHQSFVLATVVDRSGSAPRAMGARMAALPDGTIRGTIGGGLLEADTLKAIPQVFEARRPLTKEFKMTGKGFSATPEMICGGRAEVLMEYVEAADPAQVRLYRELCAAAEAGQPACLITALPAPAGDVGHGLLNPAGTLVAAGAPLVDERLARDLAERAGRHSAELVVSPQGRFLVEPISDHGTVYIFGAGHIGQQLAPVCNLVGFKTVVIDDRPEYANREVFDTADRVILLKSFAQALEGLELDRNSYVVIVTRGHVDDKTVLAQVLKTPAGYVGMIGSRRKRDTVYRALLADGFTVQDLARIFSPIGLPIGGETPEEIAVSIVAEMIKVRAQRSHPQPDEDTSAPRE